MDEYKYADKSREKKRRQKLAEEKLKFATQSDKIYKHRQLPKGSWSAKKLVKQRKVERKFKKARKKEFLKKRNADDMMSSNIINVIDDEWKELQKEERLAKKLKKGKIKKEKFEEFEKEIGLNNKLD
jgi:ATP-dependent RNA helicase DDX55/SPB4